MTQYATHTERSSARCVTRVVIAPVFHTFLTGSGTTLGATECDILAQALYTVIGLTGEQIRDLWCHDPMCYHCDILPLLQPRNEG